MSGGDEYVQDPTAELDVELLERLHGANRYCLHPLTAGKMVPDLDGDQPELVTQLLRLARLGAEVRRLAAVTPRRRVDAVLAEANLRLSGAMRLGLRPGRLGD